MGGPYRTRTGNAPSSRAERSADPGSMPEPFRNGSRIGAAHAACPG
eukprot:gene42568-56581_t